MRRTIVVAVSLGLLAGALSMPADAKKKPKPKPKPFVTSGSIAIAHPGNADADAGIVRAEFLQNCAIPASQGTDGYVVEIPATHMKKTAAASAVGSSATGGYDLDMFFYSDTCSALGESVTIGTDEIGTMPKGTKYVLINSWEPAGPAIDFTFTATPGK